MVRKSAGDGTMAKRLAVLSTEIQQIQGKLHALRGKWEFLARQMERSGIEEEPQAVTAIDTPRVTE